MPEATKHQCGYIEVTWTKEPDTEHPELGVFDTLNWTEPCGMTADHRLVTHVEGVGKRQDFLCCKHRTDTMGELTRSEHCGVSVLEDHILARLVVCEVEQLPDGYVYRPVILTCNGRHRMPAMKLAATTLEEAKGEAEMKVAILRASLLRGDSQ